MERGKKPQMPMMIEGDEIVRENQSPPMELGEHGNAIWAELLPLICGSIRQRDIRTLAAYCLAWDRFMTIRNQIGQDPSVWTPNGFAPHPMLKEEHRALDQIGMFGKKLGLEPEGRRMKSAEHKDVAIQSAADVLKLRRG